MSCFPVIPDPTRLARRDVPGLAKWAIEQGIPGGPEDAPPGNFWGLEGLLDFETHERTERHLTPREALARGVWVRSATGPRTRGDWHRLTTEDEVRASMVSGWKLLTETDPEHHNYGCAIPTPQAEWFVAWLRDEICPRCRQGRNLWINDDGSGECLDVLCGHRWVRAETACEGCGSHRVLDTRALLRPPLGQHCAEQACEWRPRPLERADDTPVRASRGE